jgi:hypothetical protein
MCAPSMAAPAKGSVIGEAAGTLSFGHSSAMRATSRLQPARLRDAPRVLVNVRIWSKRAAGGAAR